MSTFVVHGTTGTNFNMRNITFRNLRIAAHPKTNSCNANKLLVLNAGYKSVSNWLFENLTIDDKNSDEGDLYGTAASPINGITFRTFKLGGVKVMSLPEANMDANTFSSNIIFQ